jgi:hypothetical protein
MSSPLSSSELRDLRMAMSDLLSEFTSRVDHGEALGELFHEDAILRTPRGEIHGRDAIASLFSTSFESRRASGHFSRHSSLDVRARALGSGRFEVRSMLVAFAINEAASGAGSLLIGDQIDVVELRADGAYRFAVRQLSPALEFSLLPTRKKPAQPG